MVSFFVLGGCSGYEKMPLAPSLISNRLIPPEMDTLIIQARQIKHPALKPVEIDEREGLTPYGAAIVAVLINPGLIAARDKKDVAAAQLLQAGILPNPHVSPSMAFPIAGALQGATVGYGYGFTYEYNRLLRAER